MGRTGFLMSGGGIDLLAAVALVAATAASPFGELEQGSGVWLSRDRYTLWLYWTAASQTLELPGFDPWVAGEPGRGESVRLLVSCRADGRAAGATGPAPLLAEFLVPLHPDARVLSYFNPWAWVLAWTGQEQQVIPLRARFDGGDPFPGRLVRPLVSWSNTRPEQTLSLPVPEALRALASPSGASFSAAGADVRLTVHFRPAPRLSRAAALAALHCRQGS